MSYMASACLHLAVVGALLYHPGPKLLVPSGSLRGDGGRPTTVTSLYISGASIAEATNPAEEVEHDRLQAPKPHRKPAKPQPQPQPAVPPTNETRPGLPGYILGSLDSGFINNHDVKIALPVIAPDPPIARTKLPDWLRGDVVVEVTIDENGNVVQTKVLEHIGFGLEQTIVETLRQWRFTPAKVDGVAVASLQDVRFHFPS